MCCLFHYILSIVMVNILAKKLGGVVRLSLLWRETT